MELESQINRNKHTHHCREQCLSLSLTENQISDLFPRKLQQHVLLRDSLFSHPPCYHLPEIQQVGCPFQQETPEATQLCSHSPRLQGTTHGYISERNFQEPFSGSGLNCGAWKKNQQAKARFQKAETII